MEIQALCEQFCKDATYFLGYSPDTIRRYRLVVQVFARALKLNIITQCTPETVREFFYRGRAERHWRTWTFRTYHTSLKMFFRWCVEHRHLPANPIEGIELPKLEKLLPARLDQDHTMVMLETVLNYPWRTPFERYRNHALLSTVVWAGLRRKELLGLHVTDLDFDRQALLVRRGKGAKDRVIPMSATLVGILRRYLAERARVRKTCPEVFTSLTRNAGLSTEGLKHLVASLRRVTGITFRLHMLRHTFATLMIEGGCEIFALSAMMGHDKITTTTGYLAASPVHLRAQIAKHPLNHASPRPS
jgi:site-specific recombinase XerD